MEERTLHAGLPIGWGHIVWLEHKVDFEFTKRIKYRREDGDFTEMYLEIQREGKERRWYTFWKETPVTYLDWIRAERFEHKVPHKNMVEEFIVECDDGQA